LDILGRPLQDALIHSKSMQHPTADSWPQDAVQAFHNCAVSSGYYDVYNESVKLFENRVREYGVERMSDQLRKLRALKMAMDNKYANPNRTVSHQESRRRPDSKPVDSLDLNMSLGTQGSSPTIKQDGSVPTGETIGAEVDLEADLLFAADEIGNHDDPEDYQAAGGLRSGNADSLSHKDDESGNDIGTVDDRVQNHVSEFLEENDDHVGLYDLVGNTSNKEDIQNGGRHLLKKIPLPSRHPFMQHRETQTDDPGLRVPRWMPSGVRHLKPFNYTVVCADEN